MCKEILPGARPPAPVEGLDMLVTFAEWLHEFHLSIMPMLVGMRGDPAMGRPEGWGLHMIGYMFQLPCSPSSKKKEKVSADDALDKIYSWFYRDTTEEDEE